MTISETEGDAKKAKEESKNNPLKLMVFLFFWFFVFIVKLIFRALIAIVSFPIQCISHVMVAPFKKELRLSEKIQKLFKKLEIYSEDTKFERKIKKSVDKLLKENRRFFYVTNSKCKKEGLRRLIKIVKKDCQDEIHRRAKIDYDKEAGVKQSIFKQRLAFIFFALAFALSFPFLTVKNILAAVLEVLVCIPRELIDKTPAFRNQRAFMDKKADMRACENLYETLKDPHQELTLQLEIIDDLATIMKKVSQYGKIICDLVSSGAPKYEGGNKDMTEADINIVNHCKQRGLNTKLVGTYVRQYKQQALEIELVDEYLTQVEIFEKSNNYVSRRLEAVMAIGGANNSYCFGKCGLMEIIRT